MVDPGDRSIDRRGFLALSAAGALVLGLDGLARAEDGWEPGAWEQARAAMKARGAHAVAIVLPPDEAGRRRVVDQLERRIPLEQTATFPRIAPWFLECVWVCTTPDRAQAQPGETLVLLDPDGKRVAGAAVALGDPDPFARGVEALLGAGLAARAAAAPADVQEHVRAIGHETEGSPASWVVENFDRAASALVHAWRSERDPGVRSSLEALLAQVYFERVVQPTGLPFGVKWKVKMSEVDPCPPCGMARSTPEGRTFVEFWGR